MQIFILCPLQIEKKYLAKELIQLGARLKPAGNLFPHLPPNPRPVAMDLVTLPRPAVPSQSQSPLIYLGCGGHGKVQFGLSAGMLLGASHQNSVAAPDQAAHPDPTAQPGQAEPPGRGKRILLTAGACGALIPELQPGTLFIPTHIVEHDYQQKFMPAALPRFPVDSPFDWAQAANHYQGILASGDEDIVDPDRAAQLAAATGAQGVAWESAGGIRAARMYGARYGEIRCVTDNPRTSSAWAKSGGSVAEQFKANLHQGMTSLARAIFSALLDI